MNSGHAPFEILPFLQLFNPTSFVVATISLLEGEDQVVPCIPNELPPGWTTFRLVDVMFDFPFETKFIAVPRISFTCKLSRPFDSNRFPSNLLSSLVYDLQQSLWYGLQSPTILGVLFPNEVVDRVEIVVRSEEEKGRVEEYFREQAKEEVARRSSRPKEEVEEYMSHVSVVARAMSV